MGAIIGGFNMISMVLNSASRVVCPFHVDEVIASSWTMDAIIGGFPRPSELRTPVRVILVELRVVVSEGAAVGT